MQENHLPLKLPLPSGFDRNVSPSPPVNLLPILLLSLGVTASSAFAAPAPTTPSKEIRVGIIGLDTSHAIAFTQTLNRGPKNADDRPRVEGVRVVAAYPQGSKDIESSTKRVPEYTTRVKELGVDIVDSIEALVERVDAVLLESNDGRVHLEQIQPVLKARKPVFIDKPVAGSLPDAIRIYRAAAAAGVPVFSSSSLRYGKSTLEARKGSLGAIKAAETFSPVNVEPSHPELFWYGIHGCESLYAVLGTGCEKVARSVDAEGKIHVRGTWKNNVSGVFTQENGKDRKGYGGTVHTDQGEFKVGAYEGYDPLLFSIVEFFRTGKAPVSAEETLELYAFMAASEESKRRNGAEVSLADVLKAAEEEAAAAANR